jgi:hypothetical protein
MAPQLKRAWASLIIGLIFFAIVIVVVISYDPIRFLENESVKKIVYGIIILGVAIYGGVVLYFRSKEQGISVIIDERDRVIGNRAMKSQLWARSLVLLIWMIGLIETYDKQQSIPLVYPFFIFITTIISGALAQSVGIIVGYTRGETNA